MQTKHMETQTEDPPQEEDPLIPFGSQYAWMNEFPRTRPLAGQASDPRTAPATPDISIVRQILERTPIEDPIKPSPAQPQPLSNRPHNSGHATHDGAHRMKLTETVTTVTYDPDQDQSHPRRTTRRC